MLKLFNGKIDLPFVPESLQQVLIEGLDGGESRIRDKVIANWCFEFYLAYRPASDKEPHRNVALEVSTQWEADCENSSSRTLSPEQFQAWITLLRECA